MNTITQGKRVGFNGASIMRLEDGLIAEYREFANSGPALLAIGFPPERVARILARQGGEAVEQLEQGQDLRATAAGARCRVVVDEALTVELA